METIDKKVKRYLIKKWNQYLRADQSAKNRFTNHKIDFIIDDVGFGWEYVRVILDEKQENNYRISYIGPTVKDFVICVMRLASNESEQFTWYDEPSYIEYTWLLSRQADILYVEAPGFSKGFFIKYADFIDSVRKGYEAMYKWETVSRVL